MAAAAQVLITFGSLFLLGLLADLAGRRTALPRVTLKWFSILTDIALAMIGFLLGQNLTHKYFRGIGLASNTSHVHR